MRPGRGNQMGEGNGLFETTIVEEGGGCKGTDSSVRHIFCTKYRTFIFLLKHYNFIFLWGKEIEIESHYLASAGLEFTV